MDDRPEDICPRPDRLPSMPAPPLVAPLYLSSVYRCADPDEADRLLSAEQEGYVYRRDGQPNADMLAAKLQALHGAERAMVCSSGMAALGAVALAQLRVGDHVVVSDQLYGRSLRLFGEELARLGIDHTRVEACQVDEVRRAICSNTRLVAVETISNPLLRVAPIDDLAALCHGRGTSLLVDNTFAGPTVCRPLAHGADWVVESLTKIIGGHSDVVLGFVCAKADHWSRLPGTAITWGLTPGTLDCYLAARGLATLALRASQANSNAQRAADFLAARAEVAWVSYPGQPTHRDHAVAARLFDGRFGAMVALELRGGREAATRFMHRATRIPFCPSLGELSTTISHPESTSHRALSPESRQALGITGGTLRLSVGIESPETICQMLAEGLGGREESRGRTTALFRTAGRLRYTLFLVAAQVARELGESPIAFSRSSAGRGTFLSSEQTGCVWPKKKRHLKSKASWHKHSPTRGFA